MATAPTSWPSALGSVDYQRSSLGEGTGCRLSPSERVLTHAPPTPLLQLAYADLRELCRMSAAWSKADSLCSKRVIPSLTHCGSPATFNDLVRLAPASSTGHRHYKNGGEGVQCSLTRSTRPYANPRRDERGLLAETTELSCEHTCRMPPVRVRWPFPILPSLPLCGQAGPAPRRTSGRSSESRDTTGSDVLPPRSKPRIRCRNIDRTQCATNVLPDTGRGDRA